MIIGDKEINGKELDVCVDATTHLVYVHDGTRWVVAPIMYIGDISAMVEAQSWHLREHKK